MPVKQTDPFYLSKEWKLVRSKVIKRDQWTCQECGILCLGRKRNKPTPHVDHIIELKKRPDLAYTMTNLQTLCASCHSKRTINTMRSEGKPLVGPDGYIIDEI